MKWSKMKKTGRREECSVSIGFTDFFDKFKNLQKNGPFCNGENVNTNKKGGGGLLF